MPDTHQAAPDEARRLALLRDPLDASACTELIRGLSEPRSIFRWFRRLSVLPESVLVGDVFRIDGDVLRKALIATAAIAIPELARLCNSVPRQHRALLPFVGAALLVGRRLDIDKVAARPVRAADARDNFEYVVGLLSEKTIPVSRGEALDIAASKNQISGLLRGAGFFDLATRMSRNVSKFCQRIRRNLYGTRFRCLTDHWSFAIGHMVSMAMLAAGSKAGILDFEAVKLWRGRSANDPLLDMILAAHPNLELVPNGGGFADVHGSHQEEWIDGRFVSCYEACGMIADRAGDDRGAILPLPPRTHPDLQRFFAATGLAATDRLVTVHCREPGFRNDARHNLRDADIATHLPALAALVRRGYRVVRLGDATMKRLPPMDGVVDYAVSPLKSPALDVLLPAIAEFHIGSSSGLSLVPLLFGTPCLYLNWHPIDMLPWGRRNRTALKPIVSRTDGRRVLDRDRYATLGQVRESPLLNAMGYEVRELAADEVEQLVLDFDASLADPPAKTGRNIGRVLLTDGSGRMLDYFGADGQPSA